ncbi:MAG: FAD-dependent oxidoreductase [Rhodospirillales bacterium]|nr:FAD-dependent oxidoreductase [Rhodospirillales bacterium]
MQAEYDLIIGGGGIAGLSAGMTAAGLGKKVMVLTGDVLGGHLLSIEQIEGFPGFPEGVAGYELCSMAQEQAARAGVEFSMTEIQHLEKQGDGWMVSTQEDEMTTRAVILATGTSLKKLGVPGEEEFLGKGVSHCASCDAPMLRDRLVCVIGGGDSALQEALTLAQAAERVSILHSGDSLTAQASLMARARTHEKIEIRSGTQVEEIVGPDTVSAVRLADGEIQVDAAFIFIGLEPNTGFLEGQLKLDDAGAIVADERMRSQTPGLFAAGTVRSGSAGRAAASAGDGSNAALAAEKYLADGLWA